MASLSVSFPWKWIVECYLIHVKHNFWHWEFGGGGQVKPRKPYLMEMAWKKYIKCIDLHLGIERTWCMQGMLAFPLMPEGRSNIILSKMKERMEKFFNVLHGFIWTYSQLQGGWKSFCGLTLEGICLSSSSFDQFKLSCISIMKDNLYCCYLHFCNGCTEHDCCLHVFL